MLCWVPAALVLLAALLLELLGTGSLLEPHLLAIGELDTAIVHKALPIPCGLVVFVSVLCVL